jgi:hypothetical protein
MSSDNFFAKFASIDPLAQAMHLPGANKYVQSQASREAGTSAANGGPYTGVTPTLAAANAGYTPGGPGANQWSAWAPQNPGGFFGFLQKGASSAGSTTPNPAGGTYFNKPTTVGGSDPWGAGGS